MKGFEAKLTSLVERVAPADLRIRFLKQSPEFEALLPSSLKRGKTYNLSFHTRSFDEGAVSGSIRGAVILALDGLESGPRDVDPIIPSWYALSRMQREVVEQALRGLAAEHKARGAKKNLANDRDAHAEYEIADAFEAALESLEFEYGNEPGTVWEPLQARNGPPACKPTDTVEVPGEESATATAARRRKLSSTVKKLRQKNRKRTEKVAAKDSLGSKS